MPNHDSRQAALGYLVVHNVLTLATRQDDALWAAAVFYANDGFDLIFLSAPHTRHARHMATNPQVAGTVQEDYPSWEAIKGIQLAGKVRLLAGVEKAAGIARYQQKFPFLASAPALIQTALTEINWYRLTPHELYFVDNSQGFAHRDAIITP